MASQKASPPTIFSNHFWFGRYMITIIILLTLIAFGIRVYRIGFLSFWFDEYIHINNVYDYLVNGNTLFDKPSNGIFLTFVIIPFFKLFGMTEFWGRLPSVIFGSLTIPLTYYLGKLLFNRYVGFFAALLLTFSLYDIFWSRIARMYSSFGFFYLLLLITFYHTFETKPFKEKYKAFYNKYKLHKKYLLLFPVALILSFINHQLTFFFFFSIGIYASIVSIYKMVHKHTDRYANKYSFIFYPASLGYIFAFIPFLNESIRPFLNIFLSERMINKAMPDWDFILQKLSNPDERFKIFFKYADIPATDFMILSILGIAGLILAFYYNKKSGLFLFSFFAFIFLIMSFIFREPSLPRYILYIYPLFMIAIAVTIFTILQKGLPYILSKKLLSKKIIQLAIIGSSIWLISLDFPSQNIKKLLTTKQHGRVVPKSISTWYFTNWRYPCQYVKQRKKPQDMMISTVVTSVKFYVRLDSCIWFRQRKYDAKKRDYVFREEPNKKYHATSYEGFVRTVKENPRGWFLADYYLYNAMTDPRARQWAFQNLRYHYYGNKEGTVKIFSWDHSTPPPKPKQFVVDVGKRGQQDASKELNLEVPKYDQAQGYRLVIDGQNFDANEALIVVNKENAKYLPKMESRKREQVSTKVPKKWFKAENNKVQFQFRKDKVDNPRYFEPGFAVYSIEAVPL